MDQLNDFLQQSFAKKYYSAKNGESLLMLGWKTNNQPVACLYTIPRQQCQIVIDDVKNTLQSNDYYILSYQLSKKIGIPFITIVFPVDVKDEGQVRFISSTDGFRNPEYLNSAKLERILLDTLKLERTPIPAKTVNKHTADFFHDWSRKHLPSGDHGIIKCDLDGLFFNKWGSSTSIVVEIKRSSIPRIPKWEPYPDDYSGLNFLRNVANTLGFRFWIMHHEGKDLTPETEISIFDVNTRVNIDVPNGPTYNNVYNPIHLKDISSLL